MQYRLQNDLAGLDRILELINSAYRGNEGAGRWTTEHHLVSGDRIDRESLVSLIEHPDSELIVGYDDDIAVACIAIKKLQHAVEFGTFAVAPYLHGMGHGSALLAYAESQARRYSQCFQVCVVNQNTALIQFYERRGYVRSGEALPYPVDQNVGQPKVADIALTLLEKPAS